MYLHDLNEGTENNLQHRSHLHHSNVMRFALADHGASIPQQKKSVASVKNTLENWS